MQKNYLAIDIGASSGRHIVGWMENGVLRTEEVYRFPNSVRRVDGHLEWDIDSLFANVKQGIREAFAKYPNIESLSIDTWAVDYVLLKNGQPLYPVYAYRDDRTLAVIPEVHSILPFAQLYARTGIQFQPFNSIYQLYADKKAGRLAEAEDFLMIPEYLLWKLCGVKAREYTNATSTGLVNAQTGEYDSEILKALGLPETMFPKLTAPGTVLGALKADIATEVGGQTKVVLCATHDTASAVEGIPMEQGDAPFLSSGTWSLLGVKLAKPITSPDSCKANFTNEGGVGYIRYLKNIMGLWMIQSVRHEVNDKYSFAEICAMAEEAKDFPSRVNANDECFLSPENMTEEVKDYCRRTGQKVPETMGEIATVIYTSLAECYAKTAKELEEITGRTYSRIHVVGGGSNAGYLNELTAKATGKEVHAGPGEATAIGNITAQMLKAGDFKSVEEARTTIHESFGIKIYK